MTEKEVIKKTRNIKIQIFISKFKEKKRKEKENKMKELEDEIKKLKHQLTNQSV